MSYRWINYLKSIVEVTNENEVPLLLEANYLANLKYNYDNHHPTNIGKSKRKKKTLNNAVQSLKLKQKMNSIKGSNNKIKNSLLAIHHPENKKLNQLQVPGSNNEKSVNKKSNKKYRRVTFDA
jgi:hypothetical protein